MRAAAKINLYLRVVGRRPDGYHEVRTVMQAVTLYDRLEFWPAARLSLRVRGERVPVRDNLVLKAARALQRASGVRKSAAILLEKCIPVGAGLGGGSSDAAATLRALNRLWGLRWPRERLAILASKLGSDVPFFLGPPTAFARGRGDEIHPIALRGSPWVLLVHPGMAVSTAEVYAALAGQRARSVAARTPAEKRLERWSDRRRLALTSEGERYKILAPEVSLRALPEVNDLEAVTTGMHPEIAWIKGRLAEQGAFRALMSGSGSTVFGLFRDRAEAARAGRSFRSRPGWRTWIVRFHSRGSSNW